MCLRRGRRLPSTEESPVSPAHPFGSDKSYWHRYTESFYPTIFEGRTIRNVAEFGTYRGDSVRWLQSVFPSAKIWSFDILPKSPEWPISESVEYRTLDQGKRSQVREVLESVSQKFDLIIEDGSHSPDHQRNCLLESIDFVAPGGVYVIEDIHTSLEELRYEGLVAPADLGHRRRRRQSPVLRRVSGFLRKIKAKKDSANRCVNVLTLVLAIERALKIGRRLSESEIAQLSTDGFINADEIATLAGAVREVLIYRRSTLPLACHQCVKGKFDYSNLRCECGARLYKDDDSMAAALFF